MGVGIPLPEIGSLSSEVKDVIKTFPLNVFLMAANAPASIKGLAELARSILFESAFDPQKREIAVLRVAHVTHALYEWTHHVELATHLGLSEQEIECIQFEDPVVSLGEEGNLLCRVADEISRDVKLSDEALGLVLARYGERLATELILCVSYFNFLSRFLESTRVELEDQSAYERLRAIS
jgi:alkylhydroperoxidase family enzyme